MFCFAIGVGCNPVSVFLSFCLSVCLSVCLSLSLSLTGLNLCCRVRPFNDLLPIPPPLGIRRIVQIDFSATCFLMHRSAIHPEQSLSAQRFCSMKLKSSSHSLTHSPIHSLTHSLVQLGNCHRCSGKMRDEQRRSYP